MVANSQIGFRDIEMKPCILLMEPTEWPSELSCALANIKQ